MPNLGEGQARKSAVLTGSMWKGFPYALEQQGWRLGAFAVAYRSDLIAAVRRTTSVKRQNARLALESCSDDGRLLAVVRLVRTAIFGLEEVVLHNASAGRSAGPCSGQHCVSLENELSPTAR